MRSVLGALLLGGCSEPPAPWMTAEGRSSPEQVWRVAPPEGHRGRFDTSGLTRWRGELVTVSDKASLPDLYALRAGDSGWMTTHPLGLWSPSAEVGTDTEGLATCADRMWMVVERDNQLLRLSETGPPSLVSLKLSMPDRPAIPAPMTWLNAGLEGVACAPDGRVWVAKEREPRAIFQVDPGTGRPIQLWDDRAWSDRPVRRGVREVWPSWSDLQFLDGHLYALHRDERAILRLSPDTGEETGRMELELDERRWYRSPEPWGMAEGLLIEEQAVWIILDNNDELLKAEPAAGRPIPLLLRYPRPAGF